MSEEGESGFFGSFTCLTKISVTPPTDESPATSNSQSASTSDSSGDRAAGDQRALLRPVPLYKQNLNSYTRKRARRQKYLKDVLMHKVVSKSNVASMMSALLQLNSRNSGIVDQSLLELWRQVIAVTKSFNGLVWVLLYMGGIPCVVKTVFNI